MPYCLKCGCKLSPKVDFCSYCGQPLKRAPAYRTTELKNMSIEELHKFYDEYCERNEIEPRTKKAKTIWWAMFYAWKEKGTWTE